MTLWLRNLLIYIAVVGTVFLLYWYIKSFSPETVDIIIKIRTWTVPYYKILGFTALISFPLFFIIEMFDKDFDEKEIKKKGYLRYFAANFPNNSTINTKPLATFFGLLGVGLVFILVILFLAPDIFQVEAPEMQEIYQEFKKNKGE